MSDPNLRKQPGPTVKDPKVVENPPTEHYTPPTSEAVVKGGKPLR